jgi:Uma2 family endonuclease
VTALPQPDHLLTVAEYAELGEIETGYTELIQGRLLMSPSPVPDHNFAAFELATQLRPQLPKRLEVLPDLDVDLELVASDQPGFSRRPDLMIVDRTARQRVRREGGMIRASEVHVVIEIVSPTSHRIDHVDKRGEYADAGIPHYWIVDIDEPISLVACLLTEEFGYQDHQRVTGTFTTEEPFPITLDLDRLR